MLYPRESTDTHIICPDCLPGSPKAGRLSLGLSRLLWAGPQSHTAAIPVGFGVGELPQPGLQECELFLLCPVQEGGKCCVMGATAATVKAPRCAEMNSNKQPLGSEAGGLGFSQGHRATSRLVFR